VTEVSKNVKPWRIAVEQAVMLAYPPGTRKDPILLRGPVSVVIDFVRLKPKSAKKDELPQTRPDLDKLTRSTLDALKTAGVYEDDGRVVDLCVSKRYTSDNPEGMPVPGARIYVDTTWAAW
jgi:Holliday junction resolvase RusA-like endonuclease